MSMTIFEIMNKFGGTKFSNRYDGQYGVEIETESLEEYKTPDLRYWKVDRDNSLRHFGIEYILKVPMTYEELPTALDEWNKFSKSVSFIPNAHSTSVHVHINFLNEQFLTMANFFATWALVENLMIKFSGPDRLSNLFCLPIRDAEGTLDSLCGILKNVDSKNYRRVQANPDYTKYGAINPAPLYNLGSVEIRSFRGDMDINVQYLWITMINRLMSYSRQQSLIPPKICEAFRDRGIRILDDIFGDLSVSLRDKMTPSEVMDLLNSNIKYTAKIASQSKNWAKFGVVFVKKVYKEHLKEALDALSEKYNSPRFDTLSYHMQLVVMEEYHTLNPTSRIVETQEDI